MKSHSFFALLLGLLPIGTYAESITASQAEITAHRFFESQAHALQAAGTTTASTDLRLVWKGPGRTSRTTAEPPFYVFNRGEKQGFVIIAGENTVNPILAYAIEGTFRTEGMPPNLQSWALSQSQYIDRVRQSGQTATSETVARWNAPRAGEGEAIDLQTPNWNQFEPYNLGCPTYLDRHTLTGCVGTATAIVMGYHRWPLKGKGTIPGYFSAHHQIQIPDLTLGETYQWNLMPYIDDTPLQEDNPDQVRAISTFMYHVAVMVRSDFGIDYTGTTLAPPTNRLPMYMGYRPDLMYLERKHFSPTVWNQMVREEIEAGRPLVYDGVTDHNEGHAFVIDGFDGEFFGVNWGWSGMSNGYYDLANLTPGEQGSGGSASGHGFNQLQGAIFRIQPLREGDVVETAPELHYTLNAKYPTGLELEEGTQLPIQAGKPFTVRTGRVQNLGHGNFTGDFHLVLTDSQGKVKQTFYRHHEADVMPSWGAFPLYSLKNRIEITLTEDPAPGDRLRIISREDGSEEWKNILCREPSGSWEIILNDSPVDPTPAPALTVHTLAGTNLESCAAATFSADRPMTPSDPTVKAYAVESFAFLPDLVVLRELQPREGRLVIPASTGVLLVTPDESTFTMTPTEGTPAELPASNLLIPASSTPAPGQPVYTFSLQDGEWRFVRSDAPSLTANEAYLRPAHPADATVFRPVFSDDETVTGIAPTLKADPDATPCYDLNGRRLLRPEGLYISNGQKRINPITR